MQKRGIRWNDKIKLAMCELEGKMQKDLSDGRKDGAWPSPDQVEAWTAQRQRQQSGGQYCGGQYCGGKTPSGCQTKEEQKRKSFVQNVLMQAAKSAAFALATLALIQGVIKVLPDSITVSSSVGGRELPIYCVETDKKQVALSFDAACGGGNLR